MPQQSPDTVVVAVEAALAATRDRMAEAGMVDALQGLARDVWANCLDRYEPGALGDTHMSLGIQAVENFKTRAVRRYLGDDREPAEDHWAIEGLTLDTPRNVLTLELSGIRIVAMKTPMAEGRHPRLELLSDWGDQSQARHAFAVENSRALGGWTAPARGQSELFEVGSPPAAIANYMLLWSGETETALTAGRLAVPVLGDHPFAAVTSLWWDDAATAAGSTTRPARPAGPGYADRPAAAPALTLKPAQPTTSSEESA